MGARHLLTLACGLAAAGCAPSYEMHPPKEPVLDTQASPDPPAARDRQIGDPQESHVDQVGLASWYGAALAGHRTASGERFDPRLYTAAHRKLPFGTWVEVRRVDTGSTVRVRINDRGPWAHPGADKGRPRIIDLSRRAAEDLELVRDGTALVELRVVHGP
jgi:rare lipoprotein A